MTKYRSYIKLKFVFLISNIIMIFCTGCNDSHTRFGSVGNQPTPKPTNSPTPQATHTIGAPVGPLPTLSATPNPNEHGLSFEKTTVGSSTHDLISQNYDISVRIEPVYQGSINRSHRDSYELDSAVQYAEVPTQ